MVLLDGRDVNQYEYDRVWSRRLSRTMLACALFLGAWTGFVTGWF